MAVTKAKRITKSSCNINQTHRDLQCNTIFITDSDNDFILDKIKIRDTIEYERNMSVDDNK